MSSRKMRRTKELAEFQFDATAAPVNLGVKFEAFCSFQFNDEIVEDENVRLADLDLYTDEIVDIPVQPESLVLIANDLDPETRDFEELKFETQQQENQPLDVTEPDPPIKEIQFSKIDVENVDSIDFKIRHGEIKRQISEFRPPNKVTTAFRLINLAINRMTAEQQEMYDLKSIDRGPLFHSTALIDKSPNSIEFINQTGTRLSKLLIDKFPVRFKDFPENEDLQIAWLNKNIRIINMLDLVFSCAYISSKIQFTNVEINDYPGFNIGLRFLYANLSCHQILRIMHFHTLHKDSETLLDFEKVVKRFPNFHGGSKLFYLEYLISEAKSGKLFFDSYLENFLELDKSWKNHLFSLYDINLILKSSSSN